ncbi:restriction endonuclease subunit S [Photobacterium iliopiscarium]|nr:restriction endonuclease subunit S [Photobacterium iliopiscarium]PSV82652.1 restriction endonuclease subunit S [Photobacterium iliopiscarium]
MSETKKAALSGKYAAYPEYKDSGVEWLGEIPEHWQSTKIKYGYDVTLGKMLQKAPKSGTDTYRKYLKAQNIQPNGIDISKVDSMWFSNEELKKLRLQCNDVLVSEGGDVGRSAIWKDQLSECYIQNAINRIRPKKGNSPFYFYYWMCSLKASDYINIICNKATIAHYTAEKVEVTPLLLPPIKEQTQIAAFLDYETAKIDTLIEKQQKLIELLKEKRKAVISHAVTKGLTPDAPMKDSGIEWLGEVPEHWDIKKSKHVFEFVTSGSRGWAEYYSDSGNLFFRIANLTRDTIEPKLNSIQCVCPPRGSEGERSKIKLDDLLISITADLGSVCVANSVIADGYVSQHVALCRPNSLIASSRWFAFFILSDAAKEQLLGSGYGGTKIQLSLEDIRELVIAFPPQKEQCEIAQFIDKSLNTFEQLISKAEIQVDLLKERRTALISAAVTGKIDVRHFTLKEGIAPTTNSDTNEAVQEAAQEAMA